MGWNGWIKIQFNSQSNLWINPKRSRNYNTGSDVSNRLMSHGNWNRGGISVSFASKMIFDDVWIFEAKSQLKKCNDCYAKDFKTRDGNNSTLPTTATFYRNIITFPGFIVVIFLFLELLSRYFVVVGFDYLKKIIGKDNKSNSNHGPNDLGSTNN